MGDESGWDRQIKVRTEAGRQAEENHSQAAVGATVAASPPAAATGQQLPRESALPSAPAPQQILTQGRHSDGHDAFAPTQQFNTGRPAMGSADTQLIPQINPAAAPPQYFQQAPAPTTTRRERREARQQPAASYGVHGVQQDYAAQIHGGQQSAPLQAAAISVQHNLIDAASHEVKPLAEMGLRHILNMMGLQLKPSKYEEARRSVVRRIRAPKPKLYRIAVLTMKSSGGKTTTTAALGQTFSSIRSDGVVAVDVDPAAPATGGLAMRTAYHPEKLSLYDMVENEDLNQHDKVQKYLSTTDFNLNVLGSGWKAEGDRVLQREDVFDVQSIMSHYYSVLLWDCGVDLNSVPVRETLDQSDALVVLVPMTYAGVDAAANTVDWLRAHGKQELLNRTVLVGNQTTSTPAVTWDKVQPVLARQQLKMHYIPFDRHLDEGLSVDLNKLAKKTKLALEDLAAILADDFVIPQPAQHNNQIAS
ncbi:ATPase [Mycobacteroides abscessus subsp. abscessus]|uniref:MinD/ParA family ATP-binding protein n=1 Tax=Mycobacteroides abscessus TaxID=36809 RepID=UPI000927A948|nr:MinD/ParA family protein [Mycobacteroides abscessus]SHU64720.1 ATPase [Mycobacteroides abscessus subsp. abscessus]